MKHLLKNAKIYDGTGSAPFHGDILLEDDRIVAVGTMENPEADMVTDLEGRSVSSGFIDGHSHNDWFAIKKDPLPYLSRSSGRASPALSPETAACQPPGLNPAAPIWTIWEADCLIIGIPPENTAPLRSTAPWWIRICPAT